MIFKKYLILAQKARGLRLIFFKSQSSKAKKIESKIDHSGVTNMADRNKKHSMIL